ncbi:hypothetical protein M0R45_013826 [Rubus argutus]|uniref:Uncharacterized protein n=1 Tax=Rubus argutus TaxID=59490 RepID=A0AAW1XKV8_RUBAR
MIPTPIFTFSGGENGSITRKRLCSSRLGDGSGNDLCEIPTPEPMPGLPQERCPYVAQVVVQQEMQNGVKSIATDPMPKTTIGNATDGIANDTATDGNVNDTATHSNESNTLPAGKKNNVGPWMMMSYRSNRKPTAAGNMKGAQNHSGSRFAPLQDEDDTLADPTPVPSQPSPNVKEIPKIVKFWKQVEAKAMTAMKDKVTDNSTTLNRKVLNDISNKTSIVFNGAEASNSISKSNRIPKQQKKATPKGDSKTFNIQPILPTLPPLVFKDVSASNYIPASNDAAIFGHTPPEEPLVDPEVSPEHVDRSDPMDTSQVLTLKGSNGQTQSIVDIECNLSSTDVEDMV